MHTVSLIELSDEKDFEIAGEGTIFDELQDKGKELPHGCLAGSCGTCKVAVLDGAENLSPAGAIEQDTLKTIYDTYDVPEGTTLRLACRAKVKGNCKVTPFKK